MKIYLIQNDGAGFSGEIDVPTGTTVRALFEQRCSGKNSKSYVIRVNQKTCKGKDVLKEGDRVSFTPSKVEGGL